MGVPAPFIDWYKHGIGNISSVTLIENNARVSIVKTNESRDDNLEECQSALNISSLERASDEGMYNCTGRNEVVNLIETTTSTSAILTVHGKPGLQYSVPVEMKELEV